MINKTTITTIAIIMNFLVFSFCANASAAILVCSNWLLDNFSAVSRFLDVSPLAMP